MGASDPPLQPGERAARSLLRRLALWLGLALVALAVLAVLGIPVPLGLLRGALESRAGDALGREVRLADLSLRLGIHPRLQVEGLRLGHVLPDRPDLLRVERAELELGLLPLVKRHVRVRRAAVAGVAVRLDPEVFPAAGPGTGAREEPGPGAPRALDWSLDVDELALSGVEVEIHRPGSDPTRGRLERLTGRLRWEEALELAFTGRYREIPLSARIEGASLARLLQGARAWPLRIEADLAGSPIEFGAKLATAGGVYRIDEVRGRAGETDVTGWLALEGLATRPKASGRIQVGSVELELPAGGEAPVSGELPPEVEHREPERVAASPTDAAASADERGPGPVAAFAAMLSDFETDLELEVERIAGFGPTVQNLSVALRVSGGELRFPLSLTADGIPMAGTLRIDQAGGEPRLAFQLAAEDFRVDQLAATLLPEAGIAGPFRELRVELEGSGHSLLGFLETLRLELRMADAALSYGAEHPVPFGVEQLELTLAERGPLRLDLRGSLLGEAIDLELSGGTMQSLLSATPWELRLEARGAGANLDLSGEARGYLADLDLIGSLRVHGERLSDLEPWVGTLPIPDAAYSLRARLEHHAEWTQLDLQEVRLGETNLVGELGERRVGAAPLLWAKLRIEQLDVSPYLEAARRSPEAEQAPAGEPAAVAFDAPILPGGLAIRDADLDLGVGGLVAGDLALADLYFRGSFRGGFLPESAFGFRLGEAAFQGAAAVDLREPPHQATFSFGTRDIDMGALLAHLGVAQGVDARAGALLLELRGEGATLDDVLHRGELVARLEDLRWTLRDPNSGSDLRIVLHRGELASPGGDEPIRLLAEGSLKGLPVQLSMQTRHLSFFRRPQERVPLELRAELAGATLEVSSGLSLPIQRSELDLSVTLSGRSLAGASALFDYELPPIGPYRLESRLRLTPSDYRLTELDLRVGESRLRGTGRLDTRGRRPRVELELTSDRVQLDDFESALARGPEAAAEPGEPAPAGTEGSPDPAVGQVREFWSPEGLLGFDGRLAVRVGQVLSGEDELGRGELLARLEDGRLALDPLQLELPGGSFELRTEYAYVARGAESGVEARIRANTERFDYGVLARRVDPKTEMGGWISLDLDIAGRAPEARTLLARADGHLDFLAAPENIDTDVFDLWAVSLLSFIVPRLDPGPRSSLNCVVARFDLEEGILSQRALLLDTTGMVVQGQAEVDFREERFRAVLTPAPKRAEFLSLGTRVEVSGGFDDLQIGVPPEELVATVIRFVSSVVVTPVQRIFGRPLPADGEDVCLEAWRKGKE